MVLLILIQTTSQNAPKFTNKLGFGAFKNKECKIMEQKIKKVLNTIIYQGSYSFNYYLVDIFTNEPYSVCEKDFFSVVGYDRSVVPMHYHKDNINRQDFFLHDILIGYRVR